MPLPAGNRSTEVHVTSRAVLVWCRWRKIGHQCVAAAWAAALRAAFLRRAVRRRSKIARVCATRGRGHQLGYQECQWCVCVATTGSLKDFLHYSVLLDILSQSKGVPLGWHENTPIRGIGRSATCRQILYVDLLQTVHALARKTCYTENAHVCQLVFC